MNKIFINSIQELYPLLIIITGIVLDFISLFITKGHNLLISSGLICVILGVIFTVKKQKKVK